MNNTALKHTILVIDDDVYNLSAAKKLLEETYDVICVPSGKLGLSAMERRDPELVLLDIYMPEMDGFEVIHMIKSQKKWVDIPVIFLTAEVSADMEVRCLEAGAVDFIGKPFNPAIMLKRIERSIELSSLQTNLKCIIDEKTKKLEDQQYTFTREIAEIVEGRDSDTGGHVRRTCNYVNIIARKLKELEKFQDILTPSYLEKLQKAAALHDIGKIQIADSILNKPGKLTPEEFDSMKRHVDYGRQMVEKLFHSDADDEYYQIVFDLVCFHHEKWNGHGYSTGKNGEDIPLAARIMAVADVFDALVSRRCYKEPLPLEEAFRIMDESAEQDFDPVIIDAFRQSREELQKVLMQGEEAAPKIECC